LKEGGGGGGEHQLSNLPDREKREKKTTLRNSTVVQRGLAASPSKTLEKKRGERTRMTPLRTKKRREESVDRLLETTLVVRRRFTSLPPKKEGLFFRQGKKKRPGSATTRRKDAENQKQKKGKGLGPFVRPRKRGRGLLLIAVCVGKRKKQQRRRGKEIKRENQIFSYRRRRRGKRSGCVSPIIGPDSGKVDHCRVWEGWKGRNGLSSAKEKKGVSDGETPKKKKGGCPLYTKGDRLVFARVLDRKKKKKKKGGGVGLDARQPTAEGREGVRSVGGVAWGGEKRKRAIR